MTQLDVIHRIENLQVVGFAVVFGIIALQSRRDLVLRYLLVSYTLGSAVSVMDVMHTGMNPRTQMMLSLALISVRYGFMTLALSLFSRSKQWFTRASFLVSALPVADAMYTASHVTSQTALILTYSAMACQYVLLVALLLTRKEKATRVPRQTLAALFLVSVFIRCILIAAIVHPTPGVVWLRDQLWFINSAVVGCITPFTIIWMMNARVHNDLRRQSLMDPLTGLMNRRGLQQAVVREMARYGRNHQNFAVAIADIDHFKSLNDTHGHSCGDYVLQEFAGICLRTLRQTDVIARSGGEEFTFILPIASDTEMHAVVDRVRTSLEQQKFKSDSGAIIRSTVSIGVTSTAGRPEITWERLLHEADAALYAAKRAGRNKTQSSNLRVSTIDLSDSADVLEGPLPIA